MPDHSLDVVGVSICVDDMSARLHGTSLATAHVNRAQPSDANPELDHACSGSP